LKIKKNNYPKQKDLMLVVIALCDFEGYKMESAPSLKAEDTSQGT